MKIGVIKETKNPPDKRVPLSPEKCLELKQKFPQVELVVESSDIRAFEDKEYSDLGIDIVTDISDCDVLLGVKEVKKEALLDNKTYFFFSHTIKKQPYNRNLLNVVLDKKIELLDHETITKEKTVSKESITALFNTPELSQIKEFFVELSKRQNDITSNQFLTKPTDNTLVAHYLNTKLKWNSFNGPHVGLKKLSTKKVVKNSIKDLPTRNELLAFYYSSI